MNNKHVNLTAYDGFEKLENFGNRINEYRQSKLESAKPHVNFIRNCFPNKTITVIELGSGNSRTLFALEKAGMLKKAYGIEISKSRFEFAESWKKEHSYKLVENINVDATNVNFDDFGDFDLCFCMNFAFQTFEPIEKGKPFKILRNTYENLQSGGKIILELNGYKEILSRIHDGNLKFWEEFPPPDPWRYCLGDCKYDSKNKFLEWKKIFIKRDEFEISESIVVIRVYKKDEICGLLKSAGFKNITLYSNWGGEDFKDATSEYIVVGSK